MKAPAFWWSEPGPASTLLSPAAFLYGTVAGARLSRSGGSVAIPVICVGNVTVGGSGKTPTALAIADLVRAQDRRPGFLLRGYGGRIVGPILVEEGRHDAAAVGDEALLLARAAPTVVARDRLAGARLLAMSGADLVIMDDGLQNPSLRKDLTLAVFDGAVGWGNGRVVPAGPLRAPLGRQWPLVDAVVVIGTGRAGDRVAVMAKDAGKPLLYARTMPDPGATERFRGRRIVAFAGIGRPDKFFETLRGLGADLVVTRSFGDHQAIGTAALHRLAQDSERSSAILVTTEKDAARIGAAAMAAFGIEALPVRLAFEDEAAVASLLDRAMAS